MGSFSWIHILLFLGVVLLLFGGRGKISGMMGDFAQGIKAFKKGMKDDEKDEASGPAKNIEANAANTHAREKDRANV